MKEHDCKDKPIPVKIVYNCEIWLLNLRKETTCIEYCPYCGKYLEELK